MLEIFASDYIAIFSDEIHNLTHVFVYESDSPEEIIKKRAERVAKVCEILSNKTTLDELKEQLPVFAAIISETIKVTPTQLRRFYTYVKSIDIANKDTKTDTITDSYKLKFLLPKLAGSSEKESLKDLYKIFGITIPIIQTVKELRLFVEFFEAILDYHSTIDPKKKD